MAKKASLSVPAVVPPKLQGQVFLLDTAIRSYQRGQMLRVIQAEGGSVVRDVTPQVNYLVLDPSRGKAGTSRAEKAAAKANTAGASIQVIDRPELYRLLLPTPGELVALLRGGAAGIQRLGNLRPPFDLKLKVTLSGADLRGADLEKAYLSFVVLDGVDLRGASLKNAALHNLSHVRFKGAVFAKTSLREAISHCSFDGLAMAVATLSGTISDCTFKKTDLGKASFSRVQLERCDFTGAILAEAALVASKGSGVVFEKASLEGASLVRIQWDRADFTRARLDRASLQLARLPGAVFAKASLVGADLSGADLSGADLSGADLSGASLADSDLSQARVDGATFLGANLRGCKLKGVDVDRAKGLAEAHREGKARTGPHLKALEQLATQARRLECEVALDDPELGRVELEVRSYSRGKSVYYREKNRLKGSWASNLQATSFAAAFRDLRARYRNAQLLVDTIKVKAPGLSQPKKQTDQQAVAAWCEVFGVAIPDAKAMRQVKKTGDQRKQTERERLAHMLRQGKKGVEEWTALSRFEREARGDLAGVDLSGVQLGGIMLGGIKARQVNLDNAQLDQATLSYADLGKASLKGTSLEGAKLYRARLAGACLDGACLKDANLVRASLGGASLKNADLTGAKLHAANLCGADLATADLSQADLSSAQYDSKTHLPPTFTQMNTLRWADKTPVPLASAPAAAPAPPPSLEFSQLLEKVKGVVDTARLEKALQMLRAERFQLFSQVDEGQVVGVVRSQSDASLVYACRLGSDGSFACCTQNLNVCGGLRGTPCKHLLVLLVGLARSEQLPPGAAYQWLEAARRTRPVLNKDTMSETFLRYKGAEAGEVDWRPTETIPEDFYAL